MLRGILFVIVVVKNEGIGGFGRIFVGLGFWELGINIKRLFSISGGNLEISLVNVWNDCFKVW